MEQRFGRRFIVAKRFFQNYAQILSGVFAVAARFPKIASKTKGGTEKYTKMGQSRNIFSGGNFFQVFSIYSENLSVGRNDRQSKNSLYQTFG